MKQKMLAAMKKSGRRVAALGVVCALLGSAGCASLGLGGTPEEIVAARAAKRWEALVAGDFEHAYDYATPSFRAVKPRAGYRSMFGMAVKWDKAIVKSVTCTAEACDVGVVINTTTVVGFARGIPSSTFVTEKWVKEDGGWWFYQKL